jgi:hypothetical protein
MPQEPIPHPQDHSRPLRNVEHERFCRIRASGAVKTDWEAYQQAYDCSRETAESTAWSLKADLGISGRLSYLLQQSATAAVLSMKERRERLARVVRANVTKLDLDQDGDLVQEITHDPETGAVVKLKLPGKRECIETDAKLAGEWDQDQTPQGDGHKRVTIALVQVFGDRTSCPMLGQPVEAEVVAQVIDTEQVTSQVTSIDVASNPEGTKEQS